MKLSELTDEDYILPELKAKDKKGVLEELVDALVRREPSIDKKALVKVLLERERLGSTGIGDGVAIPHGKFHGITHPIVSFGRSRRGLDFESMEKLAMTEDDAIYMKFISDVIRANTTEKLTLNYEMEPGKSTRFS
jgi:mannitol/fructose-specific phosphotransferase system IIA component (Ntr-type)